MKTEELVKKSIAISSAFDGMATRIAQQAKSLLRQGEILYPEFKEIMDNYYQPLMGYSSKIVMDASNQIIDEMDQYLTEIEEATARLDQVAKELMTAEAIFSGVSFVLAAAASIATFATAPSKNTFISAFNMIKQAVKSIGGMTE